MFEYGRYGDSTFGKVEEGDVPNLVTDENGRPTAKSLENLYSAISEDYAKGVRVSGQYFDNADAGGAWSCTDATQRSPRADRAGMSARYEAEGVSPRFAARTVTCPGYPDW